MKKKQGKKAIQKKSVRAFSKKSKQKQKEKAKRTNRFTRQVSKENNKTKQKSTRILPEIDMRIDGVLYKLREGGRSVYRIIPSSRRYDFELCPVGEIVADEGELVEAVITRLPDRHGVAMCRITHVFGAADSKRANYEQILTSCGIESEFSDAVLSEADRVASQKLSADGREDLRGALILTIDGADAKDLDDAVSLLRTEEGWELSVHIADVSHYVRGGGEVDREAMRRGTSVYFTDKVVPMLPRSLSNGACSLGAGEDKYAMTAHVTLDREGKLKGARITKSIIRSSVRGVYSEVNDLFEKGEESEYYGKYSRVYAMLSDMHELYKIRERIALERGYVELESAEAQIILDAGGDPTQIIRRERGDAERLIEQFMLLANEAVALYMSTRRLPCVYRIHETPDEEKLDSFIKTCHNWGIDTSSLVSGDVSALAYSHILEKAREKDVAFVISDCMLRSFMKARYSEVRSSHFGLALDYYAHFTSPIRRYPDLAVHRILSVYLERGEEIAARYASFARDAAIRSSENELRALTAERAIEDLYKTLYMKKHEGEEYTARILSVQSFGFFCVLDNTCEGLVPVSSLDGFYTYNEDMGTLASRYAVFRAGDTVRIRVKFADVQRHKTEFEYLEKLQQQ